MAVDGQRRILRILQVRSQSKELAKKVREKVNAEKQIKKAILEHYYETELCYKKAKQLQYLNAQHKKALAEVGSACRLASIQPDTERILREERAVNKQMADWRGECAQQRLTQEKRKNMIKITSPIRRKRIVREVEDFRACLVSGLPPPTRRTITSTNKTNQSSSSRSPSRSRSTRDRQESAPTREKMEKVEWTFQPIKGQIEVTSKVLIDRDHCKEPPTKLKSTTHWIDLDELDREAALHETNRMPCSDIDTRACSNRNPPSCATHNQPRRLQGPECTRPFQVSESTRRSDRPGCTRSSKPASEPVVQFYDYSSRFSKSYPAKDNLVQQIDDRNMKDAVAVAQAETERDRLRYNNAERVVELDELRTTRGREALERERAKKKCQTMLSQLGQLSKRERLVKATQIGRANLNFVSEDRLIENANRRQKHMEARFESLFRTSGENLQKEDAPMKLNVASGRVTESEEEAGRTNVANAREFRPLLDSNNAENRNDNETSFRKPVMTWRSRRTSREITDDSSSDWESCSSEASCEESLSDPIPWYRRPPNWRSPESDVVLERESDVVLERESDVAPKPCNLTAKQPRHAGYLRQTSELEQSAPLSASTSYRSPPPESQLYEKSKWRQVVDNYGSSSEASEGNPWLAYYINRLLGMTREDVRKLEVSSVSSMSSFSSFVPDKVRRMYNCDCPLASPAHGMATSDPKSWKHILKDENVPPTSLRQDCRKQGKNKKTTLACDNERIPRPCKINQPPSLKFVPTKQPDSNRNKSSARQQVSLSPKRIATKPDYFYSSPKRAAVNPDHMCSSPKTSAINADYISASRICSNPERSAVKRETERLATEHERVHHSPKRHDTKSDTVPTSPNRGVRKPDLTKTVSLHPKQTTSMTDDVDSFLRSRVQVDIQSGQAESPKRSAPVRESRTKINEELKQKRSKRISELSPLIRQIRAEQERILRSGSTDWKPDNRGEKLQGEIKGRSEPGLTEQPTNFRPKAPGAQLSTITEADSLVAPDSTSTTTTTTTTTSLSDVMGTLLHRGILSSPFRWNTSDDLPVELQSTFLESSGMMADLSLWDEMDLQQTVSSTPQFGGEDSSQDLVHATISQLGLNWAGSLLQRTSEHSKYSSGSSSSERKKTSIRRKLDFINK